MTEMQKIAKVGTDAVKKLRLQKLQKGIPFMINSRELNPGEAYMEYPDGHIELVKIAASRMDFEVIRILTSFEAKQLRNFFALKDFHQI